MPRPANKSAAKATKPSNAPSPQRQPAQQTNVSQTVQPKGAARRKQSKPAAGTPLIRDIIRLQKSTDLLIPKLPFSRVVRELIQQQNMREQMRLTPAALEALRESAESYLTYVFSDANSIVRNRGQVTLQPKDIQLLMYLRGR